MVLLVLALAEEKGPGLAAENGGASAPSHCQLIRKPAGLPVDRPEALAGRGPGFRPEWPSSPGVLAQGESPGDVEALGGGADGRPPQLGPAWLSGEMQRIPSQVGGFPVAAVSLLRFRSQPLRLWEHQLKALRDVVDSACCCWLSAHRCLVVAALLIQAFGDWGPILYRQWPHAALGASPSW